MVETTGLDNPSLAYGLSGLSDWSTEMPFLDIMKSSRDFLGHGDSFGQMSNGDLRDAGYLDADGWPTGIPDGIDSVGTVWAWGNSEQPGVEASREGIYVLNYEGEGELQISGSVNIISQEDGKIVFEATGGTILLNIEETDPESTGDYIRDITVVKEEYLELFEAGQIFNPEFLDVVKDARQFRFMDWMETNNSTQSEWDDRPQVDDASWTSGAPLEVMVELANQLGVDPWFNMPHLATDEYIRKFAEYVRDNLDPGLQATVELSNEAWNWSFGQTQDLLQMAKDEWGEDSNGNQNVNEYYGYKATEMALIWKDVFGDEAEDRLVTALGVQVVNTWSMNFILNADQWQDQDPDNYRRPADVFDVLAGTSYFAGSVISNSDLRAELLAAIDDPEIDAHAWLTGILNDPEHGASIYNTVDFLSVFADIAHDNDLGAVLYEGGQHLHHFFAVSGLTDEEAATFLDFLVDYVRSEEMADLYQILWDAWEEVGDGAFMQFGDIGQYSKYGSWGLRTGIFDSNPRADLLDELNANTEAWWENRGGEHFKQGIAVFGDETGETIEGTRAEDFLLGGGGNDTLRGLKDDDGLHGGDGSDTLYGGKGGDTLVGGNGKDTLKGGKGHDVLEGGAGKDVIKGGKGYDTASYDSADAAVKVSLSSGKASGGAGIDTLKSIESLIGSNFDDRLYGNAAENIIAGGDGDDIIKSKDGKDTLIGGKGDDALSGGKGADVFVFGSGDGEDTILDWKDGADKLDLRSFGFANFAADVRDGASQVGSDLVIDLGAGDSILITDFQLSDFHAGDVLL